MAEGDSIARLAARLRRQLAGRTVTACAFAMAGVANVDLTGRTLLAVASRGKHLLVRFDGTPALSLHLHLRMDGAVRVQRLGRGAPRVGHLVRMVLVLDQVVLVGEKLPVVELVATADEGRVVGHLGPDLCDPGWSSADTERAAGRLARMPERPVVEALLDQRNLAGVGNLYAVEGCFLSGLWPWKPLGEVGAEALLALVDLEHRMLAAGVAGSGQATTGDRRRGHAHWVYGRKDRPCRRCGTLVRFRAGDGSPGRRPTWWCPHCQPAPHLRSAR